MMIHHHHHHLSAAAAAGGIGVAVAGIVLTVSTIMSTAAVVAAPIDHPLPAAIMRYNVLVQRDVSPDYAGVGCSTDVDGEDPFEVSVTQSFAGQKVNLYKVARDNCNLQNEVLLKKEIPVNSATSVNVTEGMVVIVRDEDNPKDILGLRKILKSDRPASGEAAKPLIFNSDNLPITNPGNQTSNSGVSQSSSTSSSAPPLSSKPANSTADASSSPPSPVLYGSVLGAIIFITAIIAAVFIILVRKRRPSHAERTASRMSGGGSSTPNDSMTRDATGNMKQLNAGQAPSFVVAPKAMKKPGGKEIGKSKAARRATVQWWAAPGVNQQREDPNKPVATTSHEPTGLEYQFDRQQSFGHGGTMNATRSLAHVAKNMTGAGAGSANNFDFLDLTPKDAPTAFVDPATIPAPSTLTPGTRLRVLHPHNPELEDELTLDTNDCVVILEVYGDGWCLARVSDQAHRKSSAVGEDGMVPIACLNILTQANDEDLRSHGHGMRKKKKKKKKKDPNMLHDGTSDYGNDASHLNGNRGGPMRPIMREASLYRPESQRIFNERGTNLDSYRIEQNSRLKAFRDQYERISSERSRY